MGRNWKRDLELCNKATPGPWKVYEKPDSEPIIWSHVSGDPKGLITYQYNDLHYVNGADRFGIVRAPSYRLRSGWKDSAYQRLFLESLRNDMQFIAEAREALPYWLQKVAELVKLIEEICEAKVVEKEWICDNCMTIFPEYPGQGNIGCPQCGAGILMPKTIWDKRHLEEENRILWKKVVSDHYERSKNK